MLNAARVIGSVVLLCGVASAQAPEGGPPAPRVDARLSNDDDAFMNRQAEAFLREVDATLSRVPPQPKEAESRRSALLLLDAVLHDPYAPSRPPIQAFYHARIEHAADEMEAGKVEDGAVIWKLYNHGFVVRTPSVTIAFDLFRGPKGSRSETADNTTKFIESPGFPISDDLALRLVRQCDVLFISHRHEDHADEFIANAFLDQGKPVVAPENVFEGAAIHDRITHMKREAHALQSLPVPKRAIELKVVVYPGQQYQGKGLPNNVVLVFTPEGMSFAHNGDQIDDPYPEYQEDFAWIDKVREHHEVDVLMTNCWTNDILRIVRGFNPKLVLPGHENELGHPTWDRVPYWGDAKYLHLNYPELKASDYPVIVMTWGESYHYRAAPQG